MIFNYNLGPGGRYELEFVISSCIYKIDYFTISAMFEEISRKINFKNHNIVRFFFINEFYLFNVPTFPQPPPPKKKNNLSVLECGL